MPDGRSPSDGGCRLRLRIRLGEACGRTRDWIRLTRFWRAVDLPTVASSGDYLAVIWRQPSPEICAFRGSWKREPVLNFLSTYAGSNAFALSKLVTDAPHLALVDIEAVDVADDALLTGWVADVDMLTKAVFDLISFDDTFARVWAILAATPKADTEYVFPEWMRQAYASEVASGIRRLVDRNPRTHSVVVLLRAVAARPQVLSRSRYVARCADGETDPRFVEDVRDNASREFDELCGSGRHHDHVPAAVFEAHLERIQRATQPIVDYANRLIAHADRRGPADNVPSIADIRVALQELFKTVQFLKRCIDASHWTSPKPFAESTSWFRLFRRPWIRRGREAPDHVRLYDADGVLTDETRLRAHYDDVT